MQAVFKSFLESYKSLNKISRVFLHISFGIAYSGLIACLIIELCAGRIGDYWTLLYLAEEIVQFARSAVSLTGLSAVVAAFLPVAEEQEKA